MVAYQLQAHALAEHAQAGIPSETRGILRAFAAIDRLPYPRRVSLLWRHRILKSGFLRNFALMARI